MLVVPVKFTPFLWFLCSLCVKPLFRNAPPSAEGLEEVILIEAL